MDIKKIVVKAVVFIIAISGFSQLSMAAGTKTANFQSNVQLTPTCQISSIDISFGAAKPNYFNTTLGSVSVICSKNVSYNLVISIGLHDNANGFNLASLAGDLINYFVCTKAAVTACSGSDNESWNISQTGVGTGQVQKLPIYAFFNGQYFTPSDYSDTMTMSLTY